MNPLQVCVAALGRMCLSLIFILASLNKILDWRGTEQSIVSKLNELMNYAVGMEWATEAIQFVLPWPTLLVACAVAFELLGGLLIFLGLKVRVGALLLALFLIPTTILFHHFWFLQGSDRELQMIMFLKNLSIFGGLLIILGLGKGSKAAAAPQ
jgi:putative oxidoreductase